MGLKRLSPSNDGLRYSPPLYESIRTKKLLLTDGTDRSQRVSVHQQFDATADQIANMRVLLFDHSKQVARIKVESGRVVDVQLEDS